MNVHVTDTPDGRFGKPTREVRVTLSERNLRELTNMWNLNKEVNIINGVEVPITEIQPTLLRVVETGEFLSVTIESDNKHYAGK